MPIPHRTFGRLNKTRTDIPAHPGELRDPIVILRSTRLPSGDVDITQHLQKLTNYWSKVKLASQRILDGEQSDDKPTHYFIVRDDPTHVIEVRDYVLWGRELLSVKSTKYLDDRRIYLRIDCCFHRQLSAEFAAEFTTTDATPVAPTTAADQSNPFW